MELNVFGEAMAICGKRPLTGFYRDGCCHTGDDDHGKHTVCAVLTDEFLVFSRSRGNDLSSPAPEYGFPGLKAGDRWCLCALRWVEAWQEGAAPLIILEATHEKTLDYVPMKVLVQYAWKDEKNEAASKE